MKPLHYGGRPPKIFFLFLFCAEKRRRIAGTASAGQSGASGASGESETIKSFYLLIYAEKNVYVCVFPGPGYDAPCFWTRNPPPVLLARWPQCTCRGTQPSGGRSYQRRRGIINLNFYYYLIYGKSCRLSWAANCLCGFFVFACYCSDLTARMTAKPPGQDITSFQV